MIGPQARLHDRVPRGARSAPVSTNENLIEPPRQSRAHSTDSDAVLPSTVRATVFLRAAGGSGRSYGNTRVK
jgi:hypothetical protein